MDNVVTFRASRKKALLLLFWSICFVALGVWLSSEKPLIDQLRNVQQLKLKESIVYDSGIVLLNHESK